MARYLPCGTLIEEARGECCLRNCPIVAHRLCDSRDPHNPIEVCYARLKRAETEGATLEARRAMAGIAIPVAA